MMDETTIKVMALIQARLQAQFSAFVAVLSHPLPNQSLAQQVGDLMRSVPQEALQRQSLIGVQQIRLTAELIETKDQVRAVEIVRELLVLDQLIQAGLAELWTVPPRPKT